jgi:hypothetical protein
MERHVIKHSYHNDNGKPVNPDVWCGYNIISPAWLFHDAQHVALSVGGSVKPCSNCIKAIISELQKEL